MLSGRFARQWAGVQAKGLEQMRAEAPESDVAQAEKRVISTAISQQLYYYFVLDLSLPKEALGERRNEADLNNQANNGLKSS